MQIVSTKECTACHRTLPNTSFRKQSKNKDGLQYICKGCSSIKSAENYKGRAEVVKKGVLEKRKERQGEYREYMREYMKEVRRGETQEEH